MIYAISFIVFTFLFLGFVIVDVVIIGIIRLSKDKSRKEQFKVVEAKIAKLVNFSIFMMLASLALLAIFKDPLEIFTSVWKLTEQYGGLGVLSFIFYVWFTLDRRLTRVETKIEHIDKDTEEIQTELRNVRRTIDKIWETISKK